jgi:GT2 family glycosyltransferase
LVEVLEEDPKAGLVGAKLIYADDTLQDAGGIIWNDGSCWIYGRWDDPERPQYNRVREADYVSGACLLIRKALWDEIGGFDERYAPAYYEDTDLAMEVKKRGYTVVYQPKSVVVHFEGASCGKDERSGIKRYQTINKRKFFEKWKSVLEAEYPEPGSLGLREGRKA